ncbi:glycoside hydrolase family 31 protein [Rhodobacteraceae bacterium RKSG542]|uniref:glycoside hydrolase family 31 protein n=1 Tax=Pseudovibrio flavus TaxID=2529854 RepID=UPI0012BC81D4|nr:glycoside hydrolase family 31 protein [Pseudovibrio flavus]MTI15893.1 glycoside hydrolase family 31 protein [Pseudovibrio flavus]
MTIATELLGHTKEDGFITLHTNNADVRIIFLSDDIVRIRASFDKKFDEASYVLTKTAWEDRMDEFMKEERTRVEPLQPEFRETAKRLILQTSKLKISITKKPFGLEIYDSEGTLLHKDLKERAYVKDHLGRVYHFAERNNEDRYYGFGESAGTLDKHGTRQRMNPKDAYGYDPIKQNCLYKHIPFYIKMLGESRNAVGLFYHNMWQSEFDMGGEHSNYWHHYNYFVADGGDIDLFFIYGPTLAKVVEGYTDITGKSYMLPLYAYGYIGSTMYYPELPKDCDTEILGFIDKNHEEGIPVDNFHLSSGYCADEHNMRYFFTWNKARFPDPAGYFKAMNDKGVMNTPNIKPGILVTHPHYDEFVENDAFIKTSDGEGIYVDRWWGGPGSFMDFTNPKARNIWKVMVKRSLTEFGISSIWNDNCEYDLSDHMAQVHGEGVTSPVGEVKAILPNLMCRMSHEAIADTSPNERPYVVCRSGGPGIQRYAQTWCGDNATSWDTLKWNISTMLGMSLSGVANQGADVGGFQGPNPEAELLVRWVQHGIFMPRFSIHSCNNNNTVTEPWMYAEHTGQIRDAIKLRYQLMPYIYSLGYEANVTGAPIMRPMVYEFQNEANFDNEGVDFMFGSSLLIANVVEKGQTKRKVYLPKGSNWYDWHTHEFYEGGQTIELDVNLDSIPVFLRDNAIVPTTEGLFSLAKDKMDYLNILIVPAQDNSFTMYEDDGKSNDYKNGQFLKTTIDMQGGARTILNFRKEGEFKSTVKNVVLDVLNHKKGAFWVSVAGERIPQFLDRNKWDAADMGWIYDAGKSSVRVKYPNIEGDYEVVVSFEDFDLIGMTIEDDSEE